MESSDDLNACVSAPSSNHSEPKKRWYHDWTRSIFTIKGRNVQLSKQLSERNRDALGQWAARARATSPIRARHRLARRGAGACCCPYRRLDCLPFCLRNDRNVVPFRKHLHETRRIPAFKTVNFHQRRPCYRRPDASFLTLMMAPWNRMAAGAPRRSVDASGRREPTHRGTSTPGS